VTLKALEEIVKLHLKLSGIFEAFQVTLEAFLIPLKTSTLQKKPLKPILIFHKKPNLTP
jgi:hypothetical protein